jgi:anthranilate/para-aminobenzoate synthase component II
MILMIDNYDSFTLQPQFQYFGGIERDMMK